MPQSPCPEPHALLHSTALACWGTTWTDNSDREITRGRRIDRRMSCTSEETGAGDLSKVGLRVFQVADSVQAFPSPSYFLSLLCCPHPFLPSEFLSFSGVLSGTPPQVTSSWEPRAPYILTRTTCLKKSPSREEWTPMIMCPCDLVYHISF